MELWSSYFKIRFLQIAHDCTLLKLVLNKRVGQISLEKRKSRVCADVRKSQKPKILEKATIGCKRIITDTGVIAGQLARWLKGSDLAPKPIFPFHLEKEKSDITSSNRTGDTYFFDPRISTLFQNPLTKSVLAG